ncbi:MAG TPA: phosphotransferase, partial [Noviherbaspirillum sp.]|nr:phosphotransferase [Noviherbaspirillum sp.]
MDALTNQNKLIDRLAHILEVTEGEVSQFETHISRVLVAGKYAFKFKKAVRLPFLDFSTLEARRFYCLEEYRLNQRLAPEIYIDVVPVTGSAEHPAIGKAGEAIEYAVRMHAFEQQALWSYLASHGLLTIKDVDDLAPKLARFHLDLAAAPFDAPWGTLQTIAATSSETLSELSRLVAEEDVRDHLIALQRWEAEQQCKLAGTFKDRKAQGMVRECHGDLHCGNVLTVNGEVQVFDCIEFNDQLRWIDVMNDLAFIHMDLAFQRRGDLAARLLNRYLEITGDYQGLKVLPYYRTHRALVRAEVMLLRARQPGVPGQDAD